MLPNIQRLDLSDNNIEEISDDIKHCKNLKELNLSYNRIDSVRPLVKLEVTPALSQLRILSLCNNRLQSLYGLECLNSLQELDISHNDISSFDELRRIRHLSTLVRLWMDGNPLSYQKHARARIMSFFPDWSSLVLDGEATESVDEHLLIEHYAMVAGADSPPVPRPSPTPPSLGLIECYIQAGENVAAGGVLAEPAAWQKDDRCSYCGAVFTWALGATPRHHCRLCGRSVCGKHSNHFAPLPKLGPAYEDPQRLCDNCHQTLHRVASPKLHAQPSSTSKLHRFTSEAPDNVAAPDDQRRSKSPRTPRRRAKSANIEDVSTDADNSTATLVPSSPDGTPTTPQPPERRRNKLKKKKKKKKKKNLDTSQTGLKILAEQDQMKAKVAEIFDQGGPQALAMYQAWLEQQDRQQEANAKADGAGPARTTGARASLNFGSAASGRTTPTNDGESKMPLARSLPAGLSNEVWESDSTHSASSMDPTLIVSTSTPMRTSKSRYGDDMGAEAEKALSASYSQGEHSADAGASCASTLPSPSSAPHLPSSPIEVGKATSVAGEAAEDFSASYMSSLDTSTGYMVGTEEFLVDVYDRTNQTSSRIFEIRGESTLNVIDTITGTSVHIYDLSCLVEIKTTDDPLAVPRAARPTIRMVFVYGRRDRRVLKCTMEDIESGEAMLQLLEPIADLNHIDSLNESMTARTKCLECNEVFTLEQDRFQELHRVCPNCKSENVVDFYVSLNSSSVSRQSSASKLASLSSSLRRTSPIPEPDGVSSSTTPTKEPADLVEENEDVEASADNGGPVLDELPFDCTVVDHERKLLLDFQYLADEERCIAALNAHVVYQKEGDAGAALLPGLLVVSNQMLHVFAAASGDNGLSILGRHEWHEIKLFQVGVGRQRVRITSSTVACDVYTGDDDVLWSFLRTLAHIPQISDCAINWFDFSQLGRFNRAVSDVAVRDEDDGPFETGSLLDAPRVYDERARFEEYEKKLGLCLCVLAHLKDGEGQLHVVLLTASTLYLLVDDVESAQIAVVDSMDATDVKGLGYDTANPFEVSVLNWNEGTINMPTALPHTRRRFCTSHPYRAECTCPGLGLFLAKQETVCVFAER